MEGAMSCEIEPTSGGFKCFVSKKEAFSGDGTNDVSCVKLSGKGESQGKKQIQIRTSFFHSA